LIFSFGGIGIGAQWDAPFLTWLVDNPVFTRGLWTLDAARDGVFVVAQEHIAVATEFLGMDVPTGFMPHGIAVDAACPPDFSDAERPIDVLVTGSFQPVANPMWKGTSPQIIATIKTLGDLAEQRWKRPMRDLDVTKLFALAAQDLNEPDRVAVHRDIAPVLSWLDERLRTRRRAECILALDRAGITVHIAGAGWDQLGLRNAVRLGPMKHTNVLELARQAKVVANIGPPIFNGGWHERIPLAMASGALCVTENNDYLEADPKVCAVVERFEMSAYESLGDIVLAAINAPERRERTRAAFDLVCTQHTWAHRARAILDAVEF
jgi:hypothetical protein